MKLTLSVRVILSFVSLQLLSHGNGLAQSTELVIYFLQLILHIALGHYASSCLEPQLVVAADEGANGDGLVEAAVKAYAAYTSSVCSAVMRLVGRDELHGSDLWRA